MLPITLEQALCIARQHSEAGRFFDAEGLCRRVLRDHPKCREALYLLGHVILRQDRPTQAVPFLAKAAAQDPDLFQLQFDLAQACTAAGNLDQAIAAYRRCAQMAPEVPQPHAELGILLNKSGLAGEAVGCLETAIELDPQSAVFNFYLGVALANCGRSDGAIGAYERAAKLDPSMAEAHANMGVALRAAGRSDEALAAYGRALALNADCAEVHCNMGVALAERERMGEAIQCYGRALAIDPEFGTAHFNLANALRKGDEHEKAIDAYRRAIELKPDFVQAYSNMAMSFNDLGRDQLALEAYDRAVALRPDWAEARWNRSLTHLLLGNFERGWAEFDCRNGIEPPSSRTFPGARWNGEVLEGKTILLNYEMGLGDSLHFVRYVPLVAARAKRVILECQEALRELFFSVAGVEEVVSIQRHEAILNYDVHCSLMRLPELFRSDPANMPRTVPYLKASEARIAMWRGRLGAQPSILRVGLAWAGSRKHQNDRQRSIALAALAPLARVPNIEFVSLQRGPAAEQALKPPAGMNLIDHSGNFENMADTAAVIEQLDLVISVDTSVAHLAGALGKAVWVLLAYVPDWRWLLDRTDTPWYPQMRLFRQPRIGDWATPIRLVAQALREL